MKTIGLLGGMSWESSVEYYRIINETVKQRLGGLHSAKCLMYSVDFAEIESLQHASEWDILTATMVEASIRLESGGADCLVICTNTMHQMANEIQAAINIPLIHIADATAAEIQTKGLYKIGLLGTRFTMEGDFYRKRLEERHGPKVIIPDKKQRETVHQVIYNELVKGEIRDESREVFKDIIANLGSVGAEGVILGCTEIPLLVHQEDVDIPIFDTTQIHAEAAADWALSV